MTATERSRFITHIAGACGRIDLAQQVLHDTHERTDATLAAARRLDAIEEQLHDLKEEVLADN